MKLLAPAFRNDDAFFCRFFTEIGSYLDEADRRLHEVDFREEESQDAFVKCPFHDSRQGTKINGAALKQIASEWDQVIQGIKYFTSLNSSDKGQMDFSRAWRISMTSMFAPLYLFHKKNNPISNGKLPTSISGVFKIMLDVPTTLDLMIIKYANSQILELTKDKLPESIRLFADKTTILINGDFSCAGSPKLIDNVTDILFESYDINEEKNKTFGKNFDNPEDLKVFSYLMSSQYIVGNMYLLTTMESMERAYYIAGEEVSENLRDNEERLPLSAYERRRRFALNVMKDEENHHSIFTNFMNLCQSDLWGVKVSCDKHLKDAMDLSLNFLKSTNGMTLNNIITEYTLYQKEIEKILACIQEKINYHCKVDSFFSRDLALADFKESPFQKLINHPNIRSPNEPI